jgi:hypothetical protein
MSVARLNGRSLFYMEHSVLSGFKSPHLIWNVQCLKVNIKIGKTVLLYVYPLHLKGRTLSRNGHLSFTVLQLKEKGGF